MNRKTLLLSSFFLIVFGILFSCNTSEKKSPDLKTTIIEVVKAFKNKDAAMLNKYISKDKGLIVLFRRGTFDEYSKTDSIDFTTSLPAYMPYSDFETDFDLKFESIPTFDCDKMKWSKFGLFCDSTKRDNLLSKTASDLKEFRGDSIADEVIKAFVELEKNSRRIVLSDSKGGELVFYLTLINNKWYFTIIDRVTSDCSA
jgi:hypothetical protein